MTKNSASEIKVMDSIFEQFEMFENPCRIGEPDRLLTQLLAVHGKRRYEEMKIKKREEKK